MRMLEHRRIRRFDREPSRHSQMDEKSLATVEREDDSLAAAIDCGDDAIGKMSHQINARRRDNIGSMLRHCADPRPNHPRRERIHDGLDFRKLWHETFLCGPGLYLSGCISKRKQYDAL